MCLFAFLTGCDFAVIIPTLWERLSVDFNSSGVYMGVVISAYSFSGVISGFIMGQISDRINRTKFFNIIAIIFAICGHALYFIGISKYLILASRCISGISIGAGTVALAYIARTKSEKMRTSVISIIMASRQFGLMFGPAFNFFLRKFNFMIFDRFLCDRKSAPGFFYGSFMVVCNCGFHFSLKDIEISQMNNQVLEEVSLTEINTKSKRVESQRNFKSEFFRIEIIVILSVTFFTYFNQTSLETIISYIIVRLLGLKLNDKQMLVIGVVCIGIGVTIGCIVLPFGKP